MVFLLFMLGLVLAELLPWPLGLALFLILAGLIALGH